MKDKHNIREDSPKKSGLRKIGVFTSGGDAPGMNAAIRAVTRAAIANKLKVVGIRRGYQGMIEGDFIPLRSADVSGIIQLGGTILRTARSNEFRTAEGRGKAWLQLQKAGIDAVVVIGGDGSFTGALTMSQEYNISFVGIPGTIDNDMYGTDYTIGYETALNSVVCAVDKIRDTAVSHGRIFIIEVMGREAGLLALNSGIACGAEVILIPESKEQHEELKRFLDKGYKDKERSGIIMVAEGDEPGGALKIAEKVRREHPDLDVRVSILGHIQRGGSPTANDRVNATRMGVAAVDALLDDQKSIMIGLDNGKIVQVPFNKAVKLNHSIDGELLEIQKMLNI
ncbi:MAG: 6-phosphofructokinase [Chlorobium sp.]|uniref:6-phosphofructokinase n=1 Tax=Chlorobium sp. TaxID=1095 RepID=UPI0025C34ED2|nr:6-phosphofructokinase [Chlorobium sp.]MCF8382474.1 6-phosphofructokinase [Chlorobium sp.]